MMTLLLGYSPVCATCAACLDHDLRKLLSKALVNLGRVGKGKPLLTIRDDFRQEASNKEKAAEVCHVNHLPASRPASCR